MRRLFKAFLFVSVIALSSLFAVSTPPVSADHQPGCDDYAIVRCGASNNAELMKKVAGDKQLEAVMAKYGLSRGDYIKFANDAKRGTISKDGTIRVDGKVVGRSTMNLGRVKTDSFNKRVDIGGQTFWGGSFDDTYHADQAEVFVLMKNGQLKFAAIGSCGNPQQLVPPKPPAPEPPQPPQPPKPEPKYSCDRLIRSRVEGNRYRFTTNASASGGAKISYAVYDFGDGTTATRRDLKQPAEHTFKESSTIRVTVHVELPNGIVKKVTSPSCTSEVTVNNKPPKPPVSNAFCRQFETPELLNEDTRQYRFRVEARTDNARFTRADFRFQGPNLDTSLPSRPNGDFASINYAFPSAGDYSITATLHFVGANGREYSGDCAANLTVADKPAPPAECVPDKDGNGCEELTNAGPGTIIAGIFGGTSLSAAAGHFIIRRKLGLF